MAKIFTHKQQSRIDGLLADAELMRRTLTDPDALAEWVNWFFGDDGPYPTPCMSTAAPRSPAVRRIRAQLRHPDAGDFYADCYAYSDDRVNGEPLVHVTTELIKNAISCMEVQRDGVAGQPWSAPPAVQLDFTDQLDQLQLTDDNAVLVELRFQEQDEDMSIYDARVIAPLDAAEEFATRQQLFADGDQAHLCPELFHYFSSPPPRFWVAITPLR